MVYIYKEERTWMQTLHYFFMNVYRGYKELEVYKKGRELRMFISALSKRFPAEEKFLLVSQAKRSSRSITATIAEGYGRYTFTDTRSFFIIARGSVTETMEHLATAFDEGYITNDDLKEGEAICESCFKLINGFVSYLDIAKVKAKGKSSPITNS